MFQAALQLQNILQADDSYSDFYQTLIEICFK
jgi:hypothetical protein